MTLKPIAKVIIILSIVGTVIFALEHFDVFGDLAKLESHGNRNPLPLYLGL